ncbi:MAG: hypothetical protein LC655_02370 [Bacteroidales bacterium]|nr:hypothetical protein [Bacteroidales bacterium]
MVIISRLKKTAARAFLVLAIALGSFVLYGQHGWTFDDSDYDYEAQITASVSMDGEEMKKGTLGAFVGDECRGLAEAKYFRPEGHWVFDLRYYSNTESGETIYFRYYNPDEDIVYNANETIEFVDDNSSGSSRKPFKLTVSKNNPPVVDAPIDDQSLDEYFGTTTVDLANVFSDPDPGDILTLAVASSDESVVTASI